jgi:hypothetical protein
VLVVLVVTYSRLCRSSCHAWLQNLFLRFPGQSSTGIVTLGDFGISRPLSHSLDLASTIIGTPYYMWVTV